MAHIQFSLFYSDAASHLMQSDVYASHKSQLWSHALFMFTRYTVHKVWQNKSPKSGGCTVRDGDAAMSRGDASQGKHWWGGKYNRDLKVLIFWMKIVNWYFERWSGTVSWASQNFRLMKRKWCVYFASRINETLKRKIRWKLQQKINLS